MNIRELLDFHTRFKTNGNLFTQYVSAVQDLHLPFGVVDGVGMMITDTHKKLIKQAQRQNLLHKNVGHVRALCLSDGVQYYDVGLRAIDGRIFSRGTSLCLDEAVARAFGELYERVSMRFVPPYTEVVYESYKTLQTQKTPVFPIFELSRVTAQQKETFKDMVWDEDSIFGWIKVENFFTGEPAYVPAQLVHWGYKRHQLEPLLGEMSTNGLGAGYTYEEAVVSSASELVQRHYFFTYWYAKKAPPKILVQSVITGSAPASTKKLVQAVLEYGFTLHLLDCTPEHGTPSVAAVLTKPGLGWFLGMATKQDYGQAIERAVCEALSVYTWVMDAPGNSEAFLFSNPTLPEGFCDKSVTDAKRIHAWSQPEVAKNGDFFLQGKERMFDEVIQKSNRSAVDVLTVLTKKQMFVARAKQNYLDEVGFHSARIVAPHLYKLSLYERFSTPVLDGVEPKNTYPHPFP